MYIGRRIHILVKWWRRERKCYVYDNGFLHAKTVSVDGMVACVGTANMDFRSFGLNFEVNAVIYSDGQCKDWNRTFENDMTKCTQ